MRLISKLNDMELRYANVAIKYNLSSYVVKLGENAFKPNSIFTVSIFVFLGYFK